MDQFRLSAILNMPANFDRIRKTIHHLRAQTCRDVLELVIVTTPEKTALVEKDLLEPLAAWQVVEIAEMPSTGAGYAAGILRARAPLVVMCEDHSFPEPDWAEALIHAQQEDCAAVAPMMHNGNPASTVSWANFLLTFIEWFSPDPGRPLQSGPGHNTSYKRDVLREYPNLDQALISERVLHIDMISKGYRIRMDARAVTHHVNISLPRSYLTHSFFGGRIFGAWRAERWPKARTLVYACAFPLVPIVRLRRIWKLLNTPAKRKASRFWASLPWIVAGLTAHAFGEAVGYVAGEGRAMERYMDFEANRIDHLRSPDREILQVLSPGDRQTAGELPSKVR